MTKSSLEETKIPLGCFTNGIWNDICKKENLTNQTCRYLVWWVVVNKESAKSRYEPQYITDNSSVTSLTLLVIFVSLNRYFLAYMWFESSCGNCLINWDFHLLYLEEKEKWKSWSLCCPTNRIPRKLCFDGRNEKFCNLGQH